MLTVTARIDCRNDRLLDHDRKDVPHMGKGNLSANVHILSTISDKENVTPAYFFYKGKRIIREVYLCVCQSVI